MGLISSAIYIRVLLEIDSSIARFHCIHYRYVCCMLSTYKRRRGAQDGEDLGWGGLLLPSAAAAAFSIRTCPWRSLAVAAVRPGRRVAPAMHVGRYEAKNYVVSNGTITAALRLY